MLKFVFSTQRQRDRYVAQIVATMLVETDFSWWAHAAWVAGQGFANNPLLSAPLPGDDFNISGVPHDIYNQRIGQSRDEGSWGHVVLTGNVAIRDNAFVTRMQNSWD